MRFSAGSTHLCVRLLQMLLGIICQTTPAAYVVSWDAIKPALYMMMIRARSANKTTCQYTRQPKHLGIDWGENSSSKSQRKERGNWQKRTRQALPERSITGTGRRAIQRCGLHVAVVH